MTTSPNSDPALFGLWFPGHPGRGKSKVRKKSLVSIARYVSVPRLAIARCKTNTTMTLQDLFRILNTQLGSLSKDDLAMLAKASPDTLVGIKFGIGGRELCAASEADWVIKQRLSEDGEQYVREVFIPCTEGDKIRHAFCWPDPIANTIQYIRYTIQYI